MKRWSIITASALLILAVGLLVAKRISERRQLEASVRHDANWFVSSLQIGNHRNTMMHLSESDMHHEALARALVTHRDALLGTDFKNTGMTFRRTGKFFFADFQLQDGTIFTWRKAKAVTDQWVIHDLPGGLEREAEPGDEANPSPAVR